MFSRSFLVLTTALAILSCQVFGNLDQTAGSAGSSGSLTEEIKLLEGGDSAAAAAGGSNLKMSECHLRPVVHILQHPGCIPKPIPSFACYGTCNSYVQVSSSKFWQVERSCNCCQEIGEREASIALFCPKQIPKFRKVTTRAPVDCICRPCSAVEEGQVKALELLGSS